MALTTPLPDAEAVLQETLARLKETEKMEGEAPSSPLREDKVEPLREEEKENIPEPTPQPSLSSYYNFLGAGKIIPQKFTVPLFFALEEERVRTHTWMKIAKSKGVADIGPLEEQLKEAREELAMAKHVANCQRVSLQEENEKLKLQLQELRREMGTSSEDITAEHQGREGLQVGLGEPTSHLQERELQAQIEVQTLKQQLQQKEAQLACMASWAMDALQCRQPAKSYGLYLRDQWLTFQINALAQRGISQVQDPQQFTELCNISSSGDKAKLAEFYLHNLVLPNVTSWDPNTVLGDMQLMAFASWLNHEDKRAAEFKEVMNRELHEPLLIRAEPGDPTALILAHQHLSTNPQALSKYMDQQAQAIAHFEDMERLLGDNCVQACTRRWNTLAHSLKIREYHTPTRMREALVRVPLYKKSMQNLQASWIGLKLSPPLLLGLMEGNIEKDEHEQWEEVERQAGFHISEEDTTAEAWDVRVAVKAMKDEELD